MPTVIARNLREHLQCQSLSPKELARRADVRDSFIYDILKGKSTNPSGVTLAKVARALGVSVAQLVDDAPTAAPSLTFESIRPFDQWVALEQAVPIRLPDGGARVDYRPDPQGGLQFSRRWIEKNWQQDAAQLCLMAIDHALMLPTLSPGDQVVVNRADCTPSPPGIFLCHDGMSLLARRLEYVPVTQPVRRVRVSHDNPCYSSFEAEENALGIVGRVVWVGRRLDRDAAHSAAAFLSPMDRFRA